jgi:nuclear GTP-binding protein
LNSNLKGGESNISSAAKIVLNDFQRGKLPFYTVPPGCRDEPRTKEVEVEGEGEVNVEKSTVEGEEEEKSHEMTENKSEIIKTIKTQQKNRKKVVDNKKTQQQSKKVKKHN